MMATLVSSQERELTPEQIIQIAIANTNDIYPPLEAFERIKAELQVPNTLFIRQGNTLFIVHKAKPGIGLFRALNADDPRQFIMNSYEFIIAASRMGFDTMVTEFEDPGLLPLFRIISRNPPNDNMGYKSEQLKDGSFRVTIATGYKAGDKQ
jgi:hypothetical protein